MQVRRRNRLLWSGATFPVLVGRFRLWWAGPFTLASQLAALSLSSQLFLACAIAEQPSARVESGFDVVEDLAFGQHANEVGGFSQIVSVELVDNDAIVLFVDGERVVVIDANGLEVASAARVGSGPGEWRFVKWAGADSLGVGVVDVATLRLIRLSSDLSPAAEHPIAPVVRAGSVMGRLADGQFVSLIDPPTIPGTGPQRFLTTVIRWSPGVQEVDTITRLPGTDVFIDPAEQMFVRVPGGRVDWVAARDSIIVAGNGHHDSVFVQLAGGSAKWIRLQLPARQNKITPSDIQAFVDAEVSLVPRQEDRLRMQRTFAKVQTPAVAPRFERLILDDRGRIWCAVDTDGDARVWHVFSLTGQSLAQVRLPAPATPWIINENTVIATRSDPDGLQRVVRYLMK